MIRTSLTRAKVPTVKRNLTWRLYASNNLLSTNAELELADARQWRKSFTINTIPKRICEITFTRSSGPGGQNVNKVNTKANLRIAIKDLIPHLPSVLHSHLRKSAFYAKKSDSLIIHSDENRKQDDNSHSCFIRLHQLIIDIANHAIPGETSQTQKQKVKNLQILDNARRLQTKKTLSQKKASRRRPSFDV